MPVQTTSLGDEMSQTKSRVLDAGRRTASTVASAMETVSRRVRDRDFRGAAHDIRALVDEHPGAALAAAAVVGFVLARTLARR